MATLDNRFFRLDNFDPSNIKSQFNHVFVLVQRMPNSAYKVKVRGPAARQRGGLAALATSDSLHPRAIMALAMVLTAIVARSSSSSPCPSLAPLCPTRLSLRSRTAYAASCLSSVRWGKRRWI